MTTVAEQLHLAREAKSLSVNQVAEVTKIRTDHIRALEEGNFDVFSAPVYIKGFVRTYATLLKMDVPQVMATLDSELGKTEKFHEPPPLVEGSRGALDFLTLQLSKVNWRMAVAAFVVLGIVGFVFMGVNSRRHAKRADPLSKLAPGVYKPAPATSGETLPVPPAHK
jgi:cytoskeletal protein RodZ